MSINQSTILKIARRTSVVLLLAASAVSAFAILGDKGRTSKTNRSFLSNENFAVNPASFSLRSHYNFRGSQIINPAITAEYINLNTVLTYQKGNTTYVVPLKRKIFITTNNAGFSIHH